MATGVTQHVTLRFDSGTLVLDGLAKDAPPAHVPPVCLWDERIKRYRAPAFRYREVLTTLTPLEKAGELQLTDEARRYHTLKLTHQAQRAPFAHQKQALAAWTKNQKRGVVVLPTGAGKSYVAEMAILAAQRSTLVVVPTLDLLNQWFDVLTTAFGVEVGLVGGGYHELKDLTVTTYDSAYIHMERWGDRFGLVIFDECHHLPSPTYLMAAEACIAPFRLGLTATPERGDGRELLLDERVGPEVYRRNIKDLAGDHLAEYRVVAVQVPLTDDEAQRYKAARELYTNFIRDKRIPMSAPDGWGRFIAISSQTPEGRRAFLGYREQRTIATASSGKLKVLEGLLRQHAKDHVLVFTADNDTVYTISKRFLLPALTHQTDVKERRELLARFSDGRYPALVTSRVLNEGVNLPEANVAIILSGTGSVREHVQRLGRILRQKSGKRATLYEVVTVNTGEERTSERRREHEAYR